MPTSANSPHRAELQGVIPLKCTGATVRRLARRLTSYYDMQLQATGLKLSQYSLLAHLSEEPQSLQQLSRRLEMDRTTLTRNLKPLLDAGWVGYARSNDARQRLLVLTSPGRRKRNDARESWKTAQSALEKHMGADLIAQLHARMDKALTQLKAVLPEEN